MSIQQNLIFFFKIKEIPNVQNPTKSIFHLLLVYLSRNVDALSCLHLESRPHT